MSPDFHWFDLQGLQSFVESGAGPNSRTCCLCPPRGVLFPVYRAISLQALARYSCLNSAGKALIILTILSARAPPIANAISNGSSSSKPQGLAL